MKPNRLKYAITFFAIVIIIPSVIAWDLSSDGVAGVAPEYNRHLYTLIKYDDGSGNGTELYGGEYPNGYLLKYRGLNAYAQDTVMLFNTPIGWDLVATKFNAQTGIWSTVIYEGDIYAGTYPGGRLFHYTPGSGWSEVAGTLNGETHIRALTVFNDGTGEAVFGAAGGRLYKYNATTGGWIQVAPGSSVPILTALVPFDAGDGETIYGVGKNGGGYLQRWNKSALVWEIAAYTGGVGSGTLYQEGLLSFLVYSEDGNMDNASLYIGGKETGVWNNYASLLRYDSPPPGAILGNFTLVAYQGVMNPHSWGVTEINSLIAYNDNNTGNTIYAGGYPYGSLLKWNKTGNNFDMATDAMGWESTWSRINTLEVYDKGKGEKIYGGTEGGHLLSYPYQLPVLANFTCQDPRIGFAPFDVQCNDTSYNNPGIPFYWGWNTNFGDAPPDVYSSDRNPTHTYLWGGNFTVCQTIFYGDYWSTPLENTSIKFNYIRVLEHPPNNVIYGNVFNIYDIPLADAIVNIWNETWSSATTTDPDFGFYWFDGLPAFTNYSLRASKMGYMQSSVITVNTGAPDNWTNVNFWLYAPPTPTPTPTPTPGEVRYVTTHLVRFMCKDWSGAPIQNMNVTAVGVQSSLGSLDWIFPFFFIDLNETPVLNTTMLGSTDYGGSIVFLMVPVEKYRLNYVCESLGINESRYYYPKEERYEEIFWTTPTVYSSDHVSYLLYNQINGSFVDLGVSYTDSRGTTNNLIFWVQNSSKTTIYTTTIVSGLGTTNLTYPVSGTIDGIYYWGFSANSTIDEDRINESNYFRIEGAPKPYKIDLNLGTDAGAAEIYNWIALAILIGIAFVSSRITIRVGLVVVAVMAMFFKFIGWLQTSWLLLAIVVVFGIFWYMRYSEEEG